MRIPDDPKSSPENITCAPSQTISMADTGRSTIASPRSSHTEGRCMSASMPRHPQTHLSMGTHPARQLRQPQAPQADGSGIVVTGRPSLLALIDSTGSSAEADRGATRHTCA
ncbi:hypothetical protein SGPA1_50839 [Streptomyces misionensis JCM 4497]